MNNSQIKIKFQELFDENPDIRTKLRGIVDKIRKYVKDNPRPQGEDFEEAAQLAFLSINELITTSVSGSDVWDKKESLFHKTMKSQSTAYERENREANLISEFQQLGRFGYSLVITDKAKLDLEFNIIWQ